METSTDLSLNLSGAEVLTDTFSSPRIELDFSSIEPICLEQIRFVGGSSGYQPVPSRARFSARSLKWTAAVRALVLFLIRNRIAALRNEEPYQLVGGENSPAATLDYAITKQPRWLKDTFGCDVAGLSNIRSLIKRINSERKKGGEVVISLSDSIVTRNIRIHWGKVELVDPSMLMSIVESISKKSMLTQGTHVARESTPHSDSIKLDAEYSRIVHESRDYSAAVKKIRVRYTGLGERLLVLECHLDIVVRNDEGDASITRNYIIANVGKTPGTSLRDRLTLENPRTNVKAVAYLQSTGARIPLRFAVDTPHKKELELSLCDAIEPGSICAYSVEYSIKQLFRYNTFYFHRVSAGCVRQSMSIRLSNASKFARFHTMVELPNGDICDGVPWAKTCTIADSAHLDWEIGSPVANSVIKTFWGCGE